MPVNRQRERGSHRGLVFCAGDRRPELRHDRDGYSAAMAALCGRPLPLTEADGLPYANGSSLYGLGRDCDRREVVR